VRILWATSNRNIGRYIYIYTKYEDNGHTQRKRWWWWWMRKLKLIGVSLIRRRRSCMKPETQADDGYETCLDAMCGPHAERLMGGAHMFDPRHHPGMDSQSGRQGRPVMHSMKMEQQYGGGDPYSFVDEMPNNMEYNTCNNNNNNNSTIPPAHPTSQVKKRGRRKKSDSSRFV